MTAARELTDGERLVALEVKIDAVHEDLHSIWAALERTANRPSWAVTILLTVLSSLVVALSVALATGVGSS